MSFNKKYLLGALLGAAMLAGCEEPCERTQRTVNDLNKAKALLDEGLSAPSKWSQVCDTLVMSSDSFRDDADFVRKVADDRYRGVPAGCAEVGYVEYCRGGWIRRHWSTHPYASLDVEGFGELQATFVADASTDLSYVTEVADDQESIVAERRSGGRSERSSGGRSGGSSDRGSRPSRPTPSPSRPSQPSRPTPRPAPSRPERDRPRPVPSNPRPTNPRPVPSNPDRVRPRPVPVPDRPHARPVRRAYPRHYPRHSHWYWHYEPRFCTMTPVCYRYEHGRPKHPGYEQVQALGYELDQAAGGIETVCTKTHDGAPVEEVNATARETLTRIEQQVLPQTQRMYDNLGCSDPRRGS